MSQRTTKQEPRRAMTGYHQVLIILFGAMFFGGGGSVDITKRVKKTVGDDVRKERAMRIAEELDALPGNVVGDLISSHRDFYEALSSPELDPDAIRASLDVMIELLHEGDERGLELRFRLKDQLTAKEWGKVWDDDAAIGDWTP